jgi:hypothetical protein
MRKLSALVTAEDGSQDFLSDGLIFTPTALPYIFGADPLMFSWQSKQDLVDSILGSVGQVDLTKLDALSKELVSITSQPVSTSYVRNQQNYSLQ